MSSLSHLNLDLPRYTPDEVWELVDRIPNGPTTHWDVFSKGVLAACQNLLLPDYPEDAYGIAKTWAQRGPKYTERGFEAAWKARLKDPWRNAGMEMLRALVPREPASPDPEEILRAEWDALRQACAVVAGRARKRWLDMQSGGGDAAAYAEGSLDELILYYLWRVGRMPSYFAVTRIESVGHRFTNADDAEDFEIFHRCDAALKTVPRGESMKLNMPKDWGTVRDWLGWLSNELKQRSEEA